MSVHQPMRRCVVCRQSYPQRSLVRICRDANGHLMLLSPQDQRKHIGHRSAYVCATHRCMQGLCARPELVSKSLKAPMTTVDRTTIIKELETLISQLEQQR